MTLGELDELERLARAATSGRWAVDEVGHVGAFSVVLDDGDVGTCYIAQECDQGEADARYIVAAQPSRVLELIAVVRDAMEGDHDE